MLRRTGRSKKLINEEGRERWTGREGREWGRGKENQETEEQ